MSRVVAKKSSGGTPPGPVQRVLKLLLCFSRDRPTLTPYELSDLTGIALPTVYRYLTALKENGLVLTDEGGNGVRLSVRFVALAEAAEAADPLIDLADPIMRRLAAETGETVLLVRAVAGAATCVHRIESTHHLRTSYEPGQPLPFERGASARILIGAMSAGVRKSIISRLAQDDAPAAEHLRAGIEEAMSRGWATSAGEIDNGIWATAAAIRGTGGRVVAALTIPAPMIRMPEAMKGQVLEQVCGAADRISQRLAQSDQ